MRGQACTATSTDRIMKMTPPLMKNQWRTIAVTRKRILSQSKCFLRYFRVYKLSHSISVIILSKKIMLNEGFWTEKMVNIKMCPSTKKIIVVLQVWKDLHSDVKEGQSENQQLRQEGGGRWGSSRGGGNQREISVR